MTKTKIAFVGIVHDGKPVVGFTKIAIHQRALISCAKLILRSPAIDAHTKTNLAQEILSVPFPAQQLKEDLNEAQ